MANFDPYNYNEKITNYLFNDMTEQERAAFEERLLTDSQLAEEVERQKTILGAIASRLTYQQAMEDPHIDEARRIAGHVVRKRNTPASPQLVKYSKKQRAVHYLLVAAQIAALVLVAHWLTKTPSPDTLFASYYQPFSFNQTTVSANSQSRMLLAQSMINYNNGNYTQVVADLSGLKGQGEFTPTASLSLGLAYMGLNDYNNAQEIFLQHLQRFSDYEPEVNWYLSLTYLKQDMPGKARDLLNAIVGAESKFSKKAVKLNRRIDKMMD